MTSASAALRATRTSADLRLDFADRHRADEVRGEPQRDQIGAARLVVHRLFGAGHAQRVGRPAVLQVRGPGTGGRRAGPEPAVAGLSVITA